MNDRDTNLLESWLGNVTLGERTLRPLGAGQSVVLKRLGNGHFVDEKEPSASDMLEIVMVMYMTGKEISDYIKTKQDQREEMLAVFAAEHVEEIDSVMQTVAQAAARLAVAAMESTGEGKEISHA